MWAIWDHLATAAVRSESVPSAANGILPGDSVRVRRADFSLVKLIALVKVDGCGVSGIRSISVKVDGCGVLGIPSISCGWHQF